MPRSACDILHQEFLQVRAKLLEVAAFFDRLAQADGSEALSDSEAQLDLLRKGCDLLTDSDAEKAARMQLLFSREYRPEWRDEFEI